MTNAIFSFFAGAGFLDLGFEMSGHYKTVYVNEVYKPFNDIYKYARGKMKISAPEYGHHVDDISTLLEDSKIQKFKLDVDDARTKYNFVGFIGGPPCPDFSVAGKNKGKEGENGKLSGTYTRLICNIKPDFFLFENVKGLYRTAKHRKFFEQLKDEFRKSGYLLTEQLINALEFGVPQDRDRIILIGFHQSLLDKINIQSRNSIINNFDWEKNKAYSKEDIFSSKWPEMDKYEENGLINQPDSIIKDLTIQHWFSANDVENHPNSSLFFKPKAALIRFQTINEGDDKKKSYKRLHRWRYSPTAAYGNNEVHIHPYKPRRISVAEALSIQSLPKEFILPPEVTLTDAFKCIGNGVPYLAAKGIANNIYDYIKHNSI